MQDVIQLDPTYQQLLTCVKANLAFKRRTNASFAMGELCPTSILNTPILRWQGDAPVYAPPATVNDLADSLYASSPIVQRYLLLAEHPVPSAGGLSILNANRFNTTRVLQANARGTAPNGAGFHGLFATADHHVQVSEPPSHNTAYGVGTLLTRNSYEEHTLSIRATTLYAATRHTTLSEFYAILNKNGYNNYGKKKKKT
jgi:hypothetical protein